MPDIETAHPTVRLAEEAGFYDELTGLPNRLLQRSHLERALQRATRAGSQVAVLFLDVDAFHVLNERFGRELGDQVLIVVAARLRAALRGSDLAARLAADEFVVICEDVNDARDLAVLQGRVIEALIAPLHIGNTVVELRVSVGAALGAGHEDPGDLLTAADRSMREMKSRHDPSEARRRGLDDPS
jgi:diguanylate cyclase (GGDEF)-like protein